MSAYVVINGQQYSGIKSITVNKSLDELCSSFQFEYTDVFYYSGNGIGGINIGDTVEIFLDGDLICKGYIEVLRANKNETSYSLNAAGRSVLADIVDSSVVFPPNQFNNLPVKTIVENLLSPFNLSVSTDQGVGNDVIPSFVLEPGETVHNAILRATVRREIILKEGLDGNLILSKNGNQNIARIPDIKAYDLNLDYSQVFSDYIVLGQQNSSELQDQTSIKSKATDNTVGRYRPMVIQIEGDPEGETPQQRAKFEAAKRASESMRLAFTTVEWSDSVGNIYDINKLVYVNIPEIGINDEFIINKVNYNFNYNDGRTVDLELIKKSSYDFLLDRKVIEATNKEKKSSGTSSKKVGNAPYIFDLPNEEN